MSVTNGNSVIDQYPGFQAVNYMGDANLGNPEFEFMNYRGQGGTPTAVLAGDILGSINAYGARNNIYSVIMGTSIKFKASENYTESAGGGNISFLTTKNGTTNTVEKMNIADNGYIDIGSNLASGTRLKVSGQLVTGSLSIASSTIDFNRGNAITTSDDCGGNLNFQNLNDGGSYTLVVTGIGTSQCNFETAVTGDDAGTVTYRFKPANAARTASSHTIYSLIRLGNVVYVSWVSGF